MKDQAEHNPEPPDMPSPPVDEAPAAKADCSGPAEPESPHAAACEDLSEGPDAPEADRDRSATHEPRADAPPPDPDDDHVADDLTETDEETGQDDEPADEGPRPAGDAGDGSEEPQVATGEGEDAAEGEPSLRSQDDEDSDTDTLESPESGEREVTTEGVIEAVLFASETPLPLSKIVSLIGVGSARDVRNHIQALNEKYETAGASFRITQIANGYQLLTLPVYNTWIRRLKQSKQDSRLSQAAMETLAVVAYKQPVVRADIEAIRGVSAGEMLNRLREVGLIKIVGRAEDVGRPMLYGTTRRFLEVFGLSGLEDLPSVEEMQPGE
jgi:segregation and condensation protein B